MTTQVLPGVRPALLPVVMRAAPAEQRGPEVRDRGIDHGDRVGPRDKDAAFSEYMAARQPSLLRTAYVLTGDRHTAEDLVQTALAKLYLSWDKVQQREHVDAYVRRILVNEHNSLWRRPWKRRETVTSELPEAASHDAQHHDDELWAQVLSLPRKQRAAVVLRYYEQLSEAETAAVLGVSVGTVKSQTSRALATMRSRMTEAGGPAGVAASDRKTREEER